MTMSFRINNIFRIAFLVLLLTGIESMACSSCGVGNSMDDKVKFAYLGTAVFMGGLPFFITGLFFWMLRRKIKQSALEE